VSASDLSDPERALALNYVPKLQRPAVLALWQLDETLGRVVASTTEPMIGQMRLTWWHERLSALDAGERAAEPLLGKLAEHVLPHGVTGVELAGLIEGWEAVLDPLPLDETALATFAERRGGVLFQLSGTLLGGAMAGSAGKSWALVDFATRCSDRITAERSVVLARTDITVDRKLPKPLRILARLARAKLNRRDTEIGQPLHRFDFLRAVLG
jgi:phytoene synthase